MKRRFDRAHIVLALAAVCAMLSAGARAEEAGGIVWPNGAKAAIALTYDDSLDSHLDNALPALDARGLKATLFLSIERPATFARIEEWRAAAAAGHELANHTVFHPCKGSLPGRDWVSPEADLDSYTVRRLVRELVFANNALAVIDGRKDASRTFAYPCADFEAGGESYVDAIKPLFIAARGVSSATSWLAAGAVDPYRVETWGPVEASGEALIAYAEAVRDAGGLGTYTFHGIGGDYLSVSVAAHEELLDWLVANGDEIWVDTFANIMTHVNAAQSGN